ncbi:MULTISPECIES: queuosine precursor transporter [Pseudothermotoga]|jgi:hypothetical protein|uniref:Probable queuosine precursor transporter n=1 Tax=Pseudothermotoga lettingae (strain ATCC BAA-301 / DSM 14385 / NBRC 107922 / TMO) TaxID=416591 RepID=A8F8R7_PSELT|nr:MULTISPECIES: queuosine precursor transporter [Pseudothermotoga]ABV34551.1 conserved hypothetical integral membrane protein [Pseudothermotoga lettingae TMO]KUK21883.1 MAG: Conserved hypothetical integral membrane protein [Pseudothermotoga lettingae]MDI3494549.1 queuosine precursor transporter [Pseudothermotoga sp.]MDK2883504.1 queuosine precursor transporter [Pseudothermotoga sp.]GLI48503.1 membrane protein [Pseudothermotoga lettingae TMO]
MLSNEIIWFAEIAIVLGSSILAFRIFGKYGLYTVVVTTTIVCNLQVVKLVELFGLTATLGNVVYGASFFATDLLSELYGKKEAQKAVWLGFTSLLLTTIWMQISLWYRASAADLADPHLKSIFTLMPRIAIGSLSAYLVSQHHDVWAYHMWKKLTKNRHLWLRNNLSTMVSQAIDTLVFCIIAFLGIYNAKTFTSIVFTTYVLKWLVAVCDTPFIYLAVRISKVKSSEQELC